MKNQFFQLCNIIRNTSASVNFGCRLEVVLTIFNGSENEDVFCLLDKFKRAAKLNGSNKDDLPIIGQIFDLQKHEHWDLDNTSDMSFLHNEQVMFGVDNVRSKQ